MPDWASGPQSYTQPVITTMSTDCLGLSAYLLGVSMFSGTIPTANQAYYIPFLVRQPFTATLMFIENGGTVSGNVDVGLYRPNGARLVSKGSTAQSGTSAIQTFNITDTPLVPGLYYMGFCMDNTTGFVRKGGTNALFNRMMGVYTEAVGSVTLPSTATFGFYTDTYIPFVGVTSKAVV